MMINSIDKMMFCINLLIDFALLGAIFTINNLEVSYIAIKIVASILVCLFTLVRIYYFIKERK